MQQTCLKHRPRAARNSLNNKDNQLTDLFAVGLVPLYGE
jgi:hypothetical protein